MSNEPPSSVDVPVDVAVDVAVEERPVEERPVEERLNALEQASVVRSAELRALATTLPVAVSRRSLLAGAARDLRSAPDKGQIVRSGVRKLLRTPRVVARRLVKRR